jgi:hypothetical protein
MIYNFSIWLVEASLGILMLAAVYRFLLKDLTFFRLNRIFLIASFIGCILVPLLPFPSWNMQSADHTYPYFKLIIPAEQSPNAEMITGNKALVSSKFTTDSIKVGGYLLILIYIIGAIRKAVLLISGLTTLFHLRKKSRFIIQEDGLQIMVQNELPTFSFGTTIFLHEDTKQLTSIEREYVLRHEKTHLRQKHTLDILLYEVGSIVFWFHPAMRYLSGTLKELHEYLVDSHVTSQMNSATQYGLLLIKLATKKSYQISTINSFSNNSTFNRINMLTQPKSRSMQKLKFLATIPAVTMLVAACSFMQPNEDSKFGKQSEAVTGNSAPEKSLRIDKITWEGNTKFSAAELTDILGVRPGDLYDSTKINDRIWTHSNDGIAARYMNDGYLFFRVDVSDSAIQNKVNLTFDVNEGQKATVGKVIVKGNEKIKTDEVLNLINIKAGEPFNRSKLILAQKVLAESGYFDAKHVDINPIPDHATFADTAIGKVDFEFVVKEI